MAFRRYITVSLAAAILPVLALPALTLIPPTVGTQPSSLVLIDPPPRHCPPPVATATLGFAHRELYRAVFPPGPAADRQERLTSRLLGFPFYSLAVETIEEAPVGTGAWLLADVRIVTPLWIGLLANSCLAAAFAALLFATYRRLRREPPPGSCRRCGYPGSGSPRCSECGAPMPDSGETVAATSLA